jgi:regulator of protease activity HflC (stomatin/prohibitin superfamily)
MPQDKGYVAPYYVALLGSKNSKDPLEQAMTLEMTAYVRWRIKDPWKVMTRIAGGISEILRQMEDTIRTELQALGTKYPTFRELVTNWGEVAPHLKDKLNELVEKWGVYVEDAKVPEVNPGYQISDELKKYATELITKKKRMVAAEAREYELLKEGQGEGRAAQKRDEGFAKGLQALQKEGFDPLLLRRIEAAHELAKNTKNSTLLGGQTDPLSNLIGVMGTLPGTQELLNKDTRVSKKDAGGES